VIPKEKWVWMPHAGHLCVAAYCRFHLTTRIGPWLVSTVGEYVPDSVAREMLAEVRGIKLVGRGDAREVDWMKKCGFEDIGCDRKYETMVFRAVVDDNHLCCPFRQDSGTELDMDGYKEGGAAYRGHLAMCEKWSQKRRERKLAVKK